MNISDKADRIQEIAGIQQAIHALAEKVRVSADTAEGERRELFALIRTARSLYDIRPTDLADLTGYTRQRIWQICDMPGEAVSEPPKEATP